MGLLAGRSIERINSKYRRLTENRETPVDRLNDLKQKVERKKELRMEKRTIENCKMFLFTLLLRRWLEGKQ